MVEKVLKVLQDGMGEADGVTMQNRGLCTYPLPFITLWTCLFLLVFPVSTIFSKEYEFPDTVESISGTEQYKRPGRDFPGYLLAIEDSDKAVISYHYEKESFLVRLYGVDAPEKGQPYWQEAKDYLYKILVGKWIKVDSVVLGSKELMVAFVDLPNRTLANEELVKAGLAWVHDEADLDPDWKKTLKAFEREAKESKRGLWADPNPVPPWVFRKARGE